MSSMTIPDTREIVFQSVQLVEKCAAISIVTQEQYMEAGEFFKAVNSKIKQVKELFDNPKRAAKSAHASICEAEKKVLDPLERAKDMAEQKINVFRREQRRIEAEQAAEARRLAEIEADRQSQALKKQQEEERLRVAQQLESQGFKKEAEEIISQEIRAPAVAVVIPRPIEAAPKIDKVFDRKTYSIEIYDLDLLIKEVASGRQPTSYLLANEKVLNGMARSLKNELSIPGVRVVENVSVYERG